MNIQIAHIFVDDGFNCRGGFSQQSVAELAASMAAEGLIQPIGVMNNPRPCGDRAFFLVHGHRRLAAAKWLGWEKIEATLYGDMVERDAHRINLQENLGRRDLTPSQEMRAILAIYGNDPDTTEVAKEMGKSRKWVRDRLNIRDMDERIIKSVDDGLLGALDLQYISSALPGERWDIAKMLMEKKAQGIPSKQVARDLKLRKKRRTLRQMQEAKELLLDYGRSPSWTETMDWCAGAVPSTDFFGLSLDTLKKHGILE